MASPVISNAIIVELFKRTRDQVLKVVLQDAGDVGFQGSVEGQDLVTRDALRLELCLLALEGVLEGLVVNNQDTFDLFNTVGPHFVVLKRIRNN